MSRRSSPRPLRTLLVKARGRLSQQAPVRPWDEDLQLGLANFLRREQFTLRRGGPIGIGNKGAVAFRFDHGLNKFSDLVLPLLEKYSIPSTQAYFTDMFGESRREGADDRHTWDDIRAWAATCGVEPTSHSHTHSMVHGREAIEQQIRGSAEILAEQIPASIIEMYTVPGGGSHYFRGGASITDFYDTAPGRLIMDTYAVSTGFLGGNIRPLDGQVRQGLRHTTIDEAKTMPAARTLITRAARVRGGTVLMMHPARLNHGKAFTSTSQLESILAHAAALRDQGQLELMTLSGITSAHSGSSRRLNLIYSGGFPNDWAPRFKNTTGWVRGTDENGAWVETSSGGLLSQLISPGWVRPHRGIIMQVVARVRSVSGGVARIGSVTAGLSTDARVGPSWREVRAFMTIPANTTGSFEVHVGRVSGEVQVADFRLEPV